MAKIVQKTVLSGAALPVQGKRGILHFNAEARLMQELGERLVAVPEVALVELIKNAYDADAAICRVSLDNADQMEIADDGHGMTFAQFQKFWMTIGTSHKAREEYSPLYQRDLTGQKGIGRFAVRFLATKLTVTTTAFDTHSNQTTQLTATFDWMKLDTSEQLEGTEVPYVLTAVPDGTPTGTTLRLSQLRHNASFMDSSSFRTQVLKILSPLQGLDRGPFKNRFKAKVQQAGDPGFNVHLPGKGAQAESNIAADILQNYVARLIIRGEKGRVKYQVDFGDNSDVRELEVIQNHSVKNGFHADIRFIPRRKGLLTGKDVNGTNARSWLAQNSGVAIVDRGFRIRPYGDDDDDWLDLTNDANTNRRNWRTDIANENFPMSTIVRNNPALNPMLNVAGNHQLVGAVFVASSRTTSTIKIDDLIPSTDREGFLRTPGFEELKTFVRAGIEYIAHLDRLRGLEEKQRQADQLVAQTKDEFKDAIRYVADIPTLTQVERARIVSQYSELAVKIDEVEQYDREARGKLSVMGAMGVLAGFLTHEASRLKTTLRRASHDVATAAKRDPSLMGIAKKLEEGVETWNDQLEYVSTFIDATQQYKSVSFKAKPQLARVVRLFKTFCEDRGIDVQFTGDANAMVPAMPVTTYSGIFLNLLTNALKAVMAHDKSNAQLLIEVRISSDAKRHILDILDTGIGVPPSMVKRIWDPMFTTTARLDNSLGTGMGLGLTLSRQLATEAGGTVEIIPAPQGYATCFRIIFPFKTKNS
ncbi:ATP-binding protein [Janthinobacterium sp. YR213]|uniref:sensor histidine kinase n=1 Tax=Janthinobacterium sp. YR213 TaxID=1881027 RepID=UPI000885859B|nr:ATP-binding protein [Janthinobacterium sp. YR213]SDG77146.1 Signal transduction histidine kinase [Janthinobacterium sp. YR213]